MKPTENIEQIKKNNELFANALTYKIVGKSNFMQLLIKGGFERGYIDNYTKVIEKYLNDFENELQNHFYNLKK